MKRELKNKKIINKSQSGLLVSVIMIVLILVAVIIVWNIIRALTMENSNIIKLKAKSVDTSLSIKKVEGLGDPSGIINITVESLSGKIIPKNETKTIRYINRTITILVPHNITVTIPGSADIVFVIDTTGSMGTYITATKNIIQNFTNTLQFRNISSRLGMVEFKDYNVSACGGTTDFPYKVYNLSGNDFTNNLTIFNNSLNALSAFGGGDTPESHLSAINAAANMNFSNKEIIILISDAPPHAQDCKFGSGNSSAACYTGPQYILNGTGNILDILRSKNITFYYLNRNSGTCLNRADINLSNLTGGDYLEYNSASASIDVQNILMSIAYDINVTTTENRTEYINDTTTVTDVVVEYGNENEHDKLKVVVMNNSASYSYIIENVPLTLETQTYTISTGGLTNINSIELYLISYGDDGKEVTQLVSSYKP